MPSDPDAILEAIVDLASGIARQCPDCAEPASRIVALAGQVRPRAIDRGAVQDALEAEMADDDVSDARVRSAASSVARAAGEGS